MTRLEKKIIDVLITILWLMYYDRKTTIESKRILMQKKVELDKVVTEEGGS